MLVDTNIIVYAVNKDSSKCKIARKFFIDNEKSLEIAHQNIFEALRVLTHKKFPNPFEINIALKEIFEATKNCRIIIPDNKSLHLALTMIEKQNLSGNKIFDAYLASVAISNGVYEVATDNEKDFKKLGIRVFNPFEK